MSMPAPAPGKPSPPEVRRQDRIADAVPALFDMLMLKDEVDIQAAVSAISRHLVDPATPVEDAVVELHSNAPTHVLELVLCSASDDAYRALVAAILQGYQQDLEGLLSSPAPGLLSRFALCHWFLPDVCSSGTTDTSDATETLRWKDAEAGTAVLREILKLSSIDEARIRRERSDDKDLPFGVKFAKSQGERKRARREKNASLIDREAFTRYGAKVPRTPIEVQSLTKNICDVQRSALRHYLGVFRLPEVAVAIKSTFLVSPNDVSDESEEASTCSYTDSEVASTCSYEDSEEDAIERGAFSPVRPEKAALLFDSLEGFGEWSLNFTSPAARDLRQARDGKMFGIFLKKLQELSRGHFSEDNQKRLTGVQVIIPVYEAKMTGDTRLLYQVDCERCPRDGVERQVLTIHGICTHAQISRRLKDSIRHRARRLGQPDNAEYKKRCMYRNPPANPGDNVFSPATWHPRR